MKKVQLFAHRPPSGDTHLLNDPLPARVVSLASQNAETKISPTKTPSPKNGSKKSGLRA